MLDLTTPSWRKVGGGNWGKLVKGQRESRVSGLWAPWVIVHKEMGFVHAPILTVNSLAPCAPLSANTALKGTSRIRNGWFPLFSGFPGGSVYACHAGDTGDLNLTPGLGRSPGGGHGNPSSILARTMLWTEEPGGLHSIGLQRVSHVQLRMYTLTQ